MLYAILVAGVSGALIVLMIMGLGNIVLIRKKRDEGLSWKESMAMVLGKNIFSWVLTIYSLLVIGMLILGLVAPILG